MAFERLHGGMACDSDKANMRTDETRRVLFHYTGGESSEAVGRVRMPARV